MKKFITILILFLLALNASAQDDSSFVLLRTYEGDVVQATVDNLDNLYIITNSGQVKKFTAGGDSSAVYNQVRNLGQLTSIDVSNSLRPLLFYKDFSTVVVLDRFLSPRATIDLRRSDILQPAAIALSYDNNIWVYDSYDQKLKKIDEQGNRLLETPDFRTIFPQSITPQKIMNDNGFVYLADTASGIIMFDNYGTFRKKFAPAKWKSIIISGNYIISTEETRMVIFNTSNYSEKNMPFPPSFQPYIHSLSGTNKLLNFSSGRLRIFRYYF